MAKFKTRYTLPESGNKFYNTTTNGGWSSAIQGSPVCSGRNVLSNCVGQAFGRFHEIMYEILGEEGVKKLFTTGKYKDYKGNSKMPFVLPRNAENFYEIAVEQGLKVSPTPSPGAIIVWQKGATLSYTDGAGHVAIVEEVISPTCVKTSESGYGCTNPWWSQTRYKGDGNWGQSNSYKFLGFILNPAVEETTDPYPVPTRTLEQGDNGEDVKWLQWKLKELKYNCDEIDGWFGIYTLGAVLAFQFKNDLVVDGIVGSATITKLRSM